MRIIPSASTPMGKRLLKIYQDYEKILTFSEPTREGCLCKNSTEKMREEYPGEYIVEECFRPDTLLWGPCLVFEDEAEATMFLLRWS